MAGSTTGLSFLWKFILKPAETNTPAVYEYLAAYFLLKRKARTMIVNENNSMPYMKSLAICLNKMVRDGYAEDFRVTVNGLEAIYKDSHYSLEQVQVVNFYRFEGESDPDDNAILYVIETDDGTRGTLVDAYGTYNDSRVTQFMNEVHTIHKAVKH